jgi:hypothetical protein
MQWCELFSKAPLYQSLDFIVGHSTLGTFFVQPSFILPLELECNLDFVNEDCILCISQYLLVFIEVPIFTIIRVFIPLQIL